MSFIFLSHDFVEQTRSKVQIGEGIWSTVRYELREKAEEAMLKGPWSVTFQKSPAASGNPNDYYSEAPYHWPDPENPDGPYLRRDGLRYPGRFTKHREWIEELAISVMFLCHAGYYLNEKKYLHRAAELVKVWFIDPDTRMNPHLEYGQAIRNLCDGRGIGLIEMNWLDSIVHSICFLREYPDWNDVLDGFGLWLSNMLDWILTSKKGIDESRTGNNHTSWRTVHIATYAAFLNNEAVLNETFEYFKNILLPFQLSVDGSFPRELVRTRALSYSLFNLTAFTLLCELAYQRGIDLWNFRLCNERGMDIAVKYLVPYLDNPYLWPYEQIDGIIPDEQLSFQLASIRLSLPECTRVNIKRRGVSYLIRHQGHLGPLVLLPGYEPGEFTPYVWTGK